MNEYAFIDNRKLIYNLFQNHINMTIINRENEQRKA